MPRLARGPVAPMAAAHAQRRAVVGHPQVARGPPELTEPDRAIDPAIGKSCRLGSASPVTTSYENGGVRLDRSTELHGGMSQEEPEHTTCTRRSVRGHTHANV